MSFVALAIEKLRVSVNNNKLLAPRTIDNRRHIATGSSTYTDSSFINGEFPSKLTLAFVKRASAIGLWTSPPRKFEMFGLYTLVCKVNGIPLDILSFDKSFRTIYELTM